MQMLRLVDTFRAKRIPLNVVIYLGTGVMRRGWNTKQLAFACNPEVFTRDGKTLHGTVPARAGETLRPCTSCAVARLSASVRSM